MATVTVTFTITELCLRTGVSEEELTEIVGLGMIEPHQPQADTWLFDDSAVTIVHRAVRLRNELELDWPGIAVALTLLALFMILELYNATQRIAMNGSNNAFTIQQIALVMLKIVVCQWAVVHTTEILNALFEIASTVTTGISGYVGSGEVNTTVDIENAIAALPGGIGNMPVALELMVVGWMLRIVNIVVNTIVAARFIELYVYNAMASLSIATLCYQELHGIAVNFLKSYLAVALQGAVLYLVIGFYPALAGSLGTGGSITEQAWAMLGQSVILLVAVFMSGKFTKAITNAMT